MSAQAGFESAIRKLEEMQRQFEALSAEMSRPEVAADAQRMVKLSREYGQFKRILDPYAQYRRTQVSLAESRAMLADPATDEELRALAEEEIQLAAAQADSLLTQLQEKLVTGEDAAVDSIILEIRAGTGGEEAALFCGVLLSMYTRYCDRGGFSCEVLDASPSDLGGYKEVILNIKGDGVYEHLGYEGGGHRVQRVPVTEAQGRIHTSAATVAVLPEAEEVDVQIDWEKDVVEHVSRAGGPGGQNVNKVSSAIRLEHLPTGITVSMRDEKSQHKNRAKARRLLATRVHDQTLQQQRNVRDSARRTMIGSGDRSQRIRTYNFPQNRCTDHRIGLDLYSLDRIVQGDLDELIAALRAHDLQQRLANL